MDILGILKGFWESSGLAVLTWREGVMILVSFVLLYLAIAKKFEPLLLLPIAFGILLANLPGAGLMDDPTGIIDPLSTTIREGAHWYDIGILRLIYAGVKSSIFPCLIFMGVGAMTDFGPLLANPMSLLLGAAAQLGIYVAFTIAILLGFTPQEAAAIGIIRHIPCIKACSSPARSDSSCGIFVYGAYPDYSAAHHEAAHHEERALGRDEAAQNRQ